MPALYLGYLYVDLWFQAKLLSVVQSLVKGQDPSELMRTQLSAEQQVLTVCQRQSYCKILSCKNELLAVVEQDRLLISTVAIQGSGRSGKTGKSQGI